MNMYNLLLGGGDFLLGESTGYSLMSIFIVCSFVPVRPLFGADASCVSSFECSKIESADHT